MKPNGLAKRNPFILLMCEVTKIEMTRLSNESNMPCELIGSLVVPFERHLPGIDTILSDVPTIVYHPVPPLCHLIGCKDEFTPSVVDLQIISVYIVGT